MIRHLQKTPFVLWCEPTKKLDACERLPHRTSHPTEATCLRCLQLAVLGIERELFDVKHGGAA